MRTPTFQDILENDDIKLDWMFKFSLIMDLANVRAFKKFPCKKHKSNYAMSLILILVACHITHVNIMMTM